MKSYTPANTHHLDLSPTLAITPEDYLIRRTAYDYINMGWCITIDKGVVKIDLDATEIYWLTELNGFTFRESIHFDIMEKIPSIREAYSLSLLGVYSLKYGEIDWEHTTLYYSNMSMAEMTVSMEFLRFRAKHDATLRQIIEDALCKKIQIGPKKTLSYLTAVKLTDSQATALRQRLLMIAALTREKEDVLTLLELIPLLKIDEYLLDELHTALTKFQWSSWDQILEMKKYADILPSSKLKNEIFRVYLSNLPTYNKDQS